MNEDEIVIKRPIEIARRYLSTWFLCDALASFPFYLITCGIGHACVPETDFGAILPAASLLCGMRVSRIARSPAARGLLLLNPTNSVVDSQHTGAYALLRLGAIFLWLSHAAGCLYWYVHARPPPPPTCNQ